jgi:hypothetical protein
MKMKIIDRILLLITALLAAYLVVVSIEGMNSLSMFSYTIAIGVLLVAALLLLIMGWEILDSPLVVIVSTIIPLALSLGLIAEYFPSITTVYLIFVIVGFLAVVYTRFKTPGKPAVIVLAVVHGIAGLIIFLLPIILSIQGVTSPGFALVGIGGALIGVGGLLLSFLKSGAPILSKEQILTLLPWILMLMTVCFVVGFRLT